MFYFSQAQICDSTAVEDNWKHGGFKSEMILIFIIKLSFVQFLEDSW